MQIPDTTEELIVWLEHYFPPRCKQPNETIEDHVRYAGKVELVEYIKVKQQQKDEDQLTEQLNGE